MFRFLVKLGKEFHSKYEFKTEVNANEKLNNNNAVQMNVRHIITKSQIRKRFPGERTCNHSARASPV